MSFQYRTLYIAIVILIFMLAVVGILLMVGKGKKEYPPEIGNCPDYWELLEDGTCDNRHNLGKGCPTPINFNAEQYQGAAGKIKKCQIIKNCGASWDGITNVGLCQKK